MKARWRAWPPVLMALLTAACAAPEPTPEKAGNLASPDDPAALLRLAGRLAAMGELGAAERLYMQASAREPDNPDPVTRLGHFYQRSGQFRPAAAAYDKALMRDAGYPPAHVGLARLALQQGQADPARAHLKAAEEAGADSAFFFAVKGLERDLAGAHDRAQTIYDRGLARFPDRAELRRQKALSLALAGQGEAARRLAQALISEADRPDGGVRVLAVSHALEGDVADAMAVTRDTLGKEAAADAALFYAELAGLPAADRRRAVMLGRWPDAQISLPMPARPE